MSNIGRIVLCDTDSLLVHKSSNVSAALHHLIGADLGMLSIERDDDYAVVIKPKMYALTANHVSEIPSTVTYSLQTEQNEQMEHMDKLEQFIATDSPPHTTFYHIKQVTAELYLSPNIMDRVRCKGVPQNNVSCLVFNNIQEAELFRMHLDGHIGDFDVRLSQWYNIKTAYQHYKTIGAVGISFNILEQIYKGKCVAAIYWNYVKNISTLQKQYVIKLLSF